MRDILRGYFEYEMNFDTRRCTLKVVTLKFRPILSHQMPNSLLHLVARFESLHFIFFFDSNTLESNLEYLIHKLSIFTLSVKWRKNIKPKGNQKYINKTFRHYNNWKSGGLFREAAFFIPTTDLLVILQLCHFRWNWSSTQQNASQIWGILAVRGVFLTVTSPAV